MTHETITVDTHVAVKALMDADFPEEQAEAIVNTIKKINLSHLATKSDIKDVRADMRELEITMKADMQILKRDMTIQMWMVGAMVIGVMAAFKFIG